MSKWILKTFLLWYTQKTAATPELHFVWGDRAETQEYPLAGLPIMLVLGDYSLWASEDVREKQLYYSQNLKMWRSRPSHFIIIPNTKRHPNNTKTDQLPISEVITGLPRPYHNISLPRPRGGSTPFPHSSPSLIHTRYYSSPISSRHDNNSIESSVLLTTNNTRHIYT